MSESNFDWIFEDNAKKFPEIVGDAALRYNVNRLHQQIAQTPYKEQIKMFIAACDSDTSELSDELNLVSFYLRPFRTDYSMQYSYEIPDRYLEDSLAEILASTSPVYSIASRIEAGYRAGLNAEVCGIVASDAEWRSEVQVAIDACVPIFVMPSHDKGIIWEIEEIRRQGALCKTIFIMPARIIDPIPKLDGELFWNRSSRAFKRKFGQDLPMYSSLGAWFTLNEDFSVKKITRDFLHIKTVSPIQVDGFSLSESKLEKIKPLIFRELLADGSLGMAKSEGQWNELIQTEEPKAKALFQKRQERILLRIQFAYLVCQSRRDWTYPELRCATDLQRDEMAAKVKREYDKIRKWSDDKFQRNLDYFFAQNYVRSTNSRFSNNKDTSIWTVIGWIFLSIMILRSCIG